MDEFSRQISEANIAYLQGKMTRDEHYQQILKIRELREAARNDETTDIRPEGRTVRTTTGRVFGWDIREYRRTDGLGGGLTYLYDAAEIDGPGLSPGFDTYDEAVAWACEQIAAQRILDSARKRAEYEAIHGTPEEQAREQYETALTTPEDAA